MTLRAKKRHKGVPGVYGRQWQSAQVRPYKIFFQFLQNHKVLNINILISLQGESHVACSVMIVDLLHHINLWKSII